MGGNAFYSNAEAYAFEILQQKLMKEAQRSAQQTIMELSALKSLFNQGQFIYCIPFNLPPHPASFPFSPMLPAFCSPDPVFPPPDPLCHSLNSPPAPPSAPPPPPPPPPPPGPPSSLPPNPSPCAPPILPSQQSTVHVNVRNAQPKPSNAKLGSDECSIDKDGIEVTIDLREYLPAEIFINVEERSVEMKACHIDSQGTKTFARRYDLPACIILDSVKCILTHDGYLMFSAGWVKME